MDKGLRFTNSIVENSEPFVGGRRDILKYGLVGCAIMVPLGGTAPTSLVVEQDSRQQAALISEIRRLAFWRKLSLAEPDVLGGFGRPKYWPGYGGRYLVIRRKGRVMIASDGLSNPFEYSHAAANGFGCELFIETPDIPKEFQGSRGDVAPILQSWAYALLQGVCATVAYRGGIADEMAKFGVVSFDIPGVNEHPSKTQFPRGYVTEDGSVGVIIGEPIPDFKTTIPNMPLSPVKVLPVVLVSAEETARLRSNSTRARKEIVAEHVASGRGHISYF